MGGNPYSFLILNIDSEIVLITCFYFSFSHDLLEIIKLVLEQFNHFWNCSNIQMKNQTVNGRRNNFQDNSNNSQKKIFEKRGAFFFLHKFCEN